MTYRPQPNTRCAYLSTSLSLMMNSGQPDLFTHNQQGTATALAIDLALLFLPPASMMTRRYRYATALTTITMTTIISPLLPLLPTLLLLLPLALSRLLVLLLLARS